MGHCAWKKVDDPEREKGSGSQGGTVPRGTALPGVVGLEAMVPSLWFLAHPLCRPRVPGVPRLLMDPGTRT